MSVAVEVLREADGYAVRVGARTIGQVHRVRLRRLDRPFAETQVKGNGRWRWRASPGVNDEDFGTRREAVAELVRRRVTPLSICRDEDCPRCGWPETYAEGTMEGGPERIGCRQCGWTDEL